MAQNGREAWLVFPQGVLFLVSFNDPNIDEEACSSYKAQPAQSGPSVIDPKANYYGKPTSC